MGRRGPPPAHPARDRAIVREARAGTLLIDLAEQHHLSVSRISQITRRAGVRVIPQHPRWGLLTDEELLDRLRHFAEQLHRRGRTLNRAAIRAAKRNVVPGHRTFENRFGSLTNAYFLAGVTHLRTR